MYSYFKGQITEVCATHITIECYGVGYLVKVPNPYQFEKDSSTTIYVYQNVREDAIELYGFGTIEEKQMFISLISVKGLGPKTALPMFASGSVSGIVDAIDRENILYLTKFPKVGDKLARQIILDLKGKLSASVANTSSNDELVEVLLNLGYKQADIKKILPKVDMTLSIENQIKEALKLMLR